MSFPGVDRGRPNRANRKHGAGGPFSPRDTGGHMDDIDFIYIDIADELRLIETVAALAGDLEVEPDGPEA